jgi:hypothetical protein
VKLDRNLNLVLEVEREEGSSAHVYVSPLSEAVFSKYFMVLSRTYAAMSAEGGEWMIRLGPRLALRMLKKIAVDTNEWEGPEGVEKGLLAEIRRATTVLTPMPDTGGWDTIPLQIAENQGYFTPSDSSEVENAVVFFLLGCAVLRPVEADSMMSAVFGLFGAQLTSSSCMDYRDFLPTSSTLDVTNEKVIPSSTPR